MTVATRSLQRVLVATRGRLGAGTVARVRVKVRDGLGEDLGRQRELTRGVALERALVGNLHPLRRRRRSPRRSGRE